MMLGFIFDKLGDKNSPKIRLSRSEVDVSVAYNTGWESISRDQVKSKESINTLLFHYRGVFRQEKLVGGDELLKVDIVP